MRDFFKLFFPLMIGAAYVSGLIYLSNIFISFMRLSAASESPGDITIEGLIVYLLVISSVAGITLFSIFQKLIFNNLKKSKLLLLSIALSVSLLITLFIQYYEDMSLLPRLL
ncbi:hypothetical protein BTR22_04395 [Alkalihalophilus pseudofirmus]|nr:hypothetical protein BTR22_04395 [Alkalihalophilus pseudofirmus]